MNYIIFRKFLTVRDCNSLLANLEYLHNPSIDLGLIDKEKSDVWHESQRNVGMSYIYSTLYPVNSLINGIKKELSECTGLDFDDSLTSKSSIFCKYIYGGVSNPHRDRDKVNYVPRFNSPDEYTFQKWTGICLLRPVLRLRDEFFINFKSGDLVDTLGKSVKNESINDRFYPELTQGDIILFRNDISIHGVDPVFSTNERITTAFRTL